MVSVLRSLAASQGAPACSVVMTSYKDCRFLREAVDSVLAQEFADFELIVVDDGSPDPAPVAALPALDPRIRVVRLPSNVGTAEAANRGIAGARSNIIARLDSDDVAEPTWLSRVLAELEANPELGIVGSSVTLIGEDGRVLGVERMPESDFAIRFTILFYCPFYHSTAAFRRELFEEVGGYRADQPISQDHYLWFAMLPLCRARNLPEPLVRYRINQAGLMATNSQGNPLARTEPIRLSLWREIGMPYPLADQRVGRDVNEFLRGRPPADPTRRADVRALVGLALKKVQAKSGDFLWASEEAQAERFAAVLQARLALDEAPPGILERTWQSLRQRGLRRTIAAAARRLPRWFPTALFRWRRADGRVADPIMAALHAVSPYAGFNPSPYPLDLQGWGASDPSFRALIAELRPRLIVEIGSWKGASAIHMADLCREFGLDARIICVDTWLGSSEHVLGLRPGWRESLRPRHGYPQLYYTFLANVLRCGHASRIVPLPNTSDTAAVVLFEKGFRPDLIYIDAAHEEQAVYRDLKNYWSLLAPGGALLGDDFAKYPAVQRAAQRFAAEIGVALDVLGDKFVLRRGFD